MIIISKSNKENCRSMRHLSTIDTTVNILCINVTNFNIKNKCVFCRKKGGAWLAPGANVSAVREFCAVQEFCGGARAALRGICGETDQDGLPLTFKYLCHLDASGWHAFVATARARVAQILMEEEFRTRAGLESLIPSNWMSLGFPFSRSFTLSRRPQLQPGVPRLPGLPPPV